MPKKKVTWEQFQAGKEYKMWSELYNYTSAYSLTSETIKDPDSGSGVYWEPFLVILFKFGNILKQTGKLKEIKMDWLRPLSYLESQVGDEIIFDDDKYILEKGAINNASQVRFAFQRLVDSINNFKYLGDHKDDFQKEYKTLHSDSGSFFKTLNAFVKPDGGFREMHENIKLILKPLRMLRKGAYRLVSIEKMEDNIESLTMFQNNKAMKQFVDGIEKFMKGEEYKMKRDCDLNALNDVLGDNLMEEFYKYEYVNKKRDFIEENEDDKRDEKFIKGNKKLSENEILQKKDDDERKALNYINIKQLKQSQPSLFMRRAFQIEFEVGLDETYKHLNKKMKDDFPIPIESHKIFVNLNKIPQGRKIQQTDFYLGKLANKIEDMKIKLYEMKINGLSRIKIPISKNKDIVDILKSVYDQHNVINNILGDILLYDQYLFFYSQIEMISFSSLKHLFESVKDKKLIEQNIPRYALFQSMRESANILQKMITHSRKGGGHFDINDYYQPTKHFLDSEDNQVINAYELNEKLKKMSTEEIENKKKILFNEISEYGRFWIMEGFFPPEDRNMWLEAIQILVEINVLVQDDIRDMILLNKEEEFLNESEKIKQEQKKLYEVKEKENVKQTGPKGGAKGHKGGKQVKHFVTQTPIKTPIITNTNINTNSKRRSSRKSSVGSSESDIINSLPKKLDGLRPPIVWNFPIGRVIKMKNDALIKEKKETPKTEIRNANPFNCYHDDRVVKFMEMFEKIYKNTDDFCVGKGDTWIYLYSKILRVLNVDYEFPIRKKEEEVKQVIEGEGEQKRNEEEKKEEGEKGEEEKKEVNEVVEEKKEIADEEQKEKENEEKAS